MELGGERTYTGWDDREVSAGQAYYLRPGHNNAHIDEDAEFVEFTRADEAPGINTVAV